VKPTFDELEEIVALATCLIISTQNREPEAMKDDYESLAFALRRLHARYPGADWSASIIDAVGRATAAERKAEVFPFQ
jgi:hypothetical protein